MLELAANNMSWGLDYLHQHDVEHGHEYQDFLGSVRSQIKYSQALNESGSDTGYVLDPIALDLEQVKVDLKKGSSIDERAIADYIDAALSEVYFARYLEESSALGHHGHSYVGHSYEVPGHGHDLFVPIFHEVKQAGEPKK